MIILTFIHILKIISLILITACVIYFPAVIGLCARILFFWLYKESLQTLWKWYELKLIHVLLAEGWSIIGFSSFIIFPLWIAWIVTE